MKTSTFATGFAVLLASNLGFAATDNVGGGGEPSRYPIEVEPHFTFGAGNVYGATGYGAGLRLGVPIVPSLLEKVPDNLAISVGADFLHYNNCYYSSRCGANYLLVPIAAQWNIFPAKRFSILAEAGVFFYQGFFDNCGVGDGPGCNSPSKFGILPTIAIGGRVHVSDNVALTLRLGYPTLTLGVSIL